MRRSVLLSTVIVFACIACPGITQAQEDTLKIGLIGDSTVATTYGWGPAFAAELNSNATVLNYAKNGATLASLSGKLDALIQQKPDYVLIQFGHNDMKQYDAETYAKKLKDYVERVSLARSKVVVLSSVTRRNFDKNGKIAPGVIEGRTLPDYAEAARVVAQEMKVPFINLNTISITHHNEIGPEASAAYNFTENDKTHFSKEGAAAIAELIIQELKPTVPELAPCFK